MTPPAQRAIREGLPEAVANAVANAVIGFLTSALLENRQVVVLRVEHRRDAYRPG